MLRVVREFDLFRKLQQEGGSTVGLSSRGSNIEGGHGALLSLLVRAMSLLLIVVLTLQETHSFFSPPNRQRFDIDMSETANLSTLKKIRVLLNVTIWDFPCIDLSLDYQDVMGTKEVDVKSTVFKERLYRNGTVVGTNSRNDPKALAGGGQSSPSQGKHMVGNVTCGACYGALPDGECCNTCSDVLYAYRMKRWVVPRIEEIAQCVNDSVSQTAYQPPQILRLTDYNSELYLPTFTRLGSEVATSSAEARISTPFKLNFSFPPLKPLKYPTNSVDGGNNRSGAFGSFGFQPLSFNFSSFGPLRFDDGFEDELVSYYPHRRRQSFGDSAKPTEDSALFTPWPDCIWRNLIIHGWNEGNRLMLNLSRFGATSGCYEDDCTRTDMFDSETLERCSVACNGEQTCHWWTWGTEGGVRKCWLREGRSGKEKRFGFASGHRHCVLQNKSDLDSNDAETRHVLDTDASNDSQSFGDLSRLDERKLSSFDIDDEYLFGPSSLHMPMFGYGGYNREEQTRRKAQAGESCRIYGYFDVNKVPGNFHIGSHGVSSPSYVSTYFSSNNDDARAKNMQHVVNQLAFVDVDHNTTLSRTQALDGFESPKAFTFQYYITITPATMVDATQHTIDGYQFRAGSFVTNELLGPAVFFRLDIDAVRVTYFTEERKWSKFVVNLCAVVGGCIALCKMLEECSETVVDIVSDRE